MANKNWVTVTVAAVVLVIIFLFSPDCGLFVPNPAENEVNVCLHLSDYGCSTISCLKELGVGWVRTDWVLTADDSMGDYSQRLEDNNINLLAIVNMSKFGSEISLEDWYKTVIDIVDSVGFNNTDAVEICNEPNHANYTIPAETYYEMLKSAYAIIKNCSDIPVVFAGVSPNCGDYKSYLNTVFASGDAEDYFDYMGIHFYYDNMADNLNVLQFVDDLTVKPIWVTETGKPSDKENYNETFQAEYLQSVCSTFNPLVNKIFIYELKDNPNLSDNKEAYFGLLTIDGKQKQAYQVVCDINAK